MHQAFKDPRQQIKGNLLVNRVPLSPDKAGADHASDEGELGLTTLKQP